MTNEKIILSHSLELMKSGGLKGTGIFAEAELNGEIVKIELPEEIHTFNGWKKRGFSVKKGEKSTIKFNIWKHTTKKKQEEQKTGNPLEDADIENMFMKLSCFFTAAQVEPIKA